jgi:hypothetical protein
MRDSLRRLIFPAAAMFLSLNIAAPAFSQTQTTAIPQTVTYESASRRPYVFLPAESVIGEVGQKEYVLRKLDMNKIGTEASYEQFEGLRLAKYITVAQRVEIYQEPRSIDAYIMDAKAMRYLYGSPSNISRKLRWVQTWDTPAHFRQQIIPLFTRAYGTEFTMSMPRGGPDDPGGFAQIRYTLDYRDIFNQYYPKYAYNSDSFKVENWDTNDIMLIHAKKIQPLGWLYTGNYGYKYSTRIAKNNDNYYNVTHTYYTNLSFVLNDRLELFGQAQYQKEIHYKATFNFRPDHYFYAGEVRIKSDDLKTSFIPRVSYSLDKYFPTYSRYQKWEMEFRVGRDFTEKFRATSAIKYQMSIRNDVDNNAPMYGDKNERDLWSPPNPINDFGAWIGTENRAQYLVYDNLWLQGGLDYSVGTNMSDFDNVGMLWGLEYYAPGLIRVDFGWRGNAYYNIDDFLSCIYFKFYLFM